MTLIQLLLPTVVGDRPTPAMLLARTKQELVEVFGGVTAYIVQYKLLH